MRGVSCKKKTPNNSDNKNTVKLPKKNQQKQKTHWSLLTRFDDGSGQDGTDGKGNAEAQVSDGVDVAVDADVAQVDEIAEMRHHGGVDHPDGHTQTPHRQNQIRQATSPRDREEGETDHHVSFKGIVYKLVRWCGSAFVKSMYIGIIAITSSS